MPDVAALPYVVGACRCGYDPGRYGSEMVGIDLLSQANVQLLIHAEGGGRASNGLGQRNRCPAMQNAHWLMRLGAHWHRGPKKIGSNFRHLNADGIGEGSPRVLSKLLDRSLDAPNTHGA